MQIHILKTLQHLDLEDVIIKMYILKKYRFKFVSFGDLILDRPTKRIKIGKFCIIFKIVILKYKKC